MNFHYGPYLIFGLCWSMMVSVWAVQSDNTKGATRARMNNLVLTDLPLSCRTIPHKKTPRSREGSMLLDEGHHVIVDWSPKAACTKVVEMVWKEMNITRGVNYAQHGFVHSYRPDFYTKCGTVSHDMMESADYYKFKVVRNPFNRAVSSYIHIMGHNLHMLPDGKSNSSAVLDLSFEDFLSDYVERVRPQVQQKHISNTGLSHFVPQASEEEVERFHQKGNKKPIFDRIVHLENFREDISLVNKDTGLNYSLSEKPTHHATVKYEQAAIYHGDRKFSDLKANHEIPDNYGLFYNRKNKKMVADIFFNDLKVYGYKFPFDKLY